MLNVLNAASTPKIGFGETREVSAIGALQILHRRENPPSARSGYYDHVKDVLGIQRGRIVTLDEEHEQIAENIIYKNYPELRRITPKLELHV